MRRLDGALLPEGSPSLRRCDDLVTSRPFITAGGVRIALVFGCSTDCPFSPQTGLVYVSGLDVPSKISVPKKQSPHKSGFDFAGTPGLPDAG